MNGITAVYQYTNPQTGVPLAQECKFNQVAWLNDFLHDVNSNYQANFVPTTIASYFAPKNAYDALVDKVVFDNVCQRHHGTYRPIFRSVVPP